MDTENNDANVDSTPTDTGSSPDVNTEPIVDDDGFVSTTEFKPVDDSSDAEGSKDSDASGDSKDSTGKEVDSDADPSDGAEPNTPKDQDSKDKPFHEHPDWIAREEKFNKLLAERDQRLEALEAKLTTNPAAQQQANDANEPKLEFDWSNMGNEKMLENITEDPKAFFSEFAMLVKQETLNELKTKEETINQQSKEEREKAAYEKYFTSTDGALDAWKDGSIQKYMDENPGETPISAHKALTEEARIKKASDDAAKKAIEDYQKELKAKGRAGSNATQPGNYTSTEASAEEKNPDRFGGAKSVAVKRYLSRLKGR